MVKFNLNLKNKTSVTAVVLLSFILTGCNEKDSPSGSNNSTTYEETKTEYKTETKTIIENNNQTDNNKDSSDNAKDNNVNVIKDETVKYDDNNNDNNNTNTETKTDEKKNTSTDKDTNTDSKSTDDTTNKNVEDPSLIEKVVYYFTKDTVSDNDNRLKSKTATVDKATENVGEISFVNGKKEKVDGSKLSSKHWKIENVVKKEEANFVGHEFNNEPVKGVVGLSVNDYQVVTSLDTSKLDQNVIDRTSYYNGQSYAEGNLASNFEIKDHDSKTLFSSTDVTLGTSKDIGTNSVSKTSSDNISDLPQFIINSGMVDTSNKWTKAKIQETFNWKPEYLERDRNFNAPDSLLDKNHMINDTTEISKLMKDEVGIIVSDTSLLGTLDYDYGRIKQYYISNVEGNDSIDKINKPLLNHGDLVTYQLIGKPYDNKKQDTYYEDGYTAKWHENGSSYFYNGFQTEKGKIAFIGQQPNYNVAINVAPAISGDNFNQLLSDGYKIVNMSFAETYNVDSLKLNNGETYTDYFKRIGWVRKTDAKAMYEAVMKDALLINALGNNADKEVSITARTPFLNNEYKDALKGWLTVAAYDPNTQKIADYSNTCKETKDYCLTANGTYWIKYNQETANKYNDGNQYSPYIHTGTSLATPYTASTAALVKSVFPFMTNTNLQQTLLTTAYDLGDKGVDDVYGWGLIQPQKAVNGPAQFYKSDFTVDFNHDSNLISNREVFKFSNDITGDYGLTVKGSDKENVLSLSGNNDYKGTTTIDEKAIVNIDGINRSKTVNNGYLYGSGLLGDVYNNNNLYNYSYFVDGVRGQHNMIIKGNYVQSENGILNLYLGNPLLVEGYASLNGGLNVQGVKTAYVSKLGKVFDDVLVSRSGIKGKFDLLITPSLLSDSELTYNMLNNNGEKLYTVSLFAKYTGLEDGIKHFKNLSKNDYTISAVRNLDKLNADINANVVSYNTEKGVEEVNEEKVSNSELANLMANIQNGTEEEVGALLKQFNGEEFTQNYQNEYKYSNLNQINQILMDKNGFNNSNYFAKDRYLSSVSVGKQFNDVLGLGLYASKYKDDHENVNYKGHSFGVNVNLFGNINLDAQTNHHKFSRNTTVSSYYNSDIMNNDLGKLNFILGYQYENDRLNKNVKNNGYIFGLDKHNQEKHNLITGFKYQFNFNDYNLGLNYVFKQQLNQNDGLKGYFKDDVLRSDVEFLNKNAKHHHYTSFDLGRNWNNFYAKLNATYYKPQGDNSDVTYGVKLGYEF